jgi:hypothetical protein
MESAARAEPHKTKDKATAIPIQPIRPKLLFILTSFLRIEQIFSPRAP